MVRDSIKRNTLLAATAVALVMSGGAWADEASDTGKSAPTIEGAPIQPGEAVNTPAPAPAGRVIATQADDQALTSDLVGAKVAGAGGEDLGKVEDLIVGGDGKIAGAVVSVGGFLGIGDKEVAVAWDALKPGGPDQPLALAMGKDQLEAAPEFLTLADQEAERQAAVSQTSGAVPAPATGSQ